MPEESIEVTDDQMLAVAEQFDAAKEAGETPEVVIQPEEPKEETQDESPPEPTTESVEEPETEVLHSTEANTDEQVSSLTEGKAPEAQEEPKSKWAKNEERKNNSWKHINAEKEEIKRQRDELLKVAEELKGRHWDSFESKRQSLMQEHEDLRESDSELTQKANAILKQYPSMANAEGLEKAVEIAQLQIKASGADKSKTQVKELTDKLTKLEKKMSVGGGFTSEKVDGERSFDDLSDKEQEAQLLRAAANFDDA